LRTGRRLESGAPPARCVGVERELGYHQRLSPDVPDRSVHLPFVVLEDPELGAPLGQPLRSVRRIPRLHSEKDQKARPDARHFLAVGSDRRPGDPLEERPHEAIPAAPPRGFPKTCSRSTASTPSTLSTAFITSRRCARSRTSTTNAPRAFRSFALMPAVRMLVLVVEMAFAMSARRLLRSWP